MGEANPGKYGELKELIKSVLTEEAYLIVDERTAELHKAWKIPNDSRVQEIVQGAVSGIEDRVSKQAQILVNDLVSKLRGEFAEVIKDKDSKSDELKQYFEDRLNNFYQALKKLDEISETRISKAAQEHEKAAEEYRTERGRLSKTIELFEGEKIVEIVHAEVEKTFDEKYTPGKEDAQLEAKIARLDSLEGRIIHAIQKKFGELMAGIPKSDELTPEQKVAIERYVEALTKKEVDENEVDRVFVKVLEERYGITPLYLRKLIKDKLESDQEKPEDGK